MGILSPDSALEWVGFVSLSLLLQCLIFAMARVVVRVWWRPKRLEKVLREQGIRGNHYRLLYGDLKETSRLIKEAKSKPLPLSHDIAPRILPSLLQIMKDHGKQSLTWFGPNPRVIITDPELIREILSKYSHFEKPETFPQAKFLRTGLLGYEGEKWVMQRKIINPAFHLEKLKCLLPAIFTCCSKLIDGWEKLLGSEEFSEVDVWPEFQSFTGDVISRTAFGSSYEEGRRIFQLQAEQAEIIIRLMYTAGYRYLPTRDNRRSKAIEKEVRALLRGIIEKRQKAMKAGVRNDDLLGYLMESNSRHLQEKRDSKKSGMTIDEVIDECKLFYFAGHETTAVLLTWTMVVLCMHPNWQERARKEVLQVFGRNKPDFDSLNHLKIVTMILYEVLRLYTPLSAVARSTSKEIKLGQFTFPSGVQFLLSIFFTHRDPEYWGEDAHEFKPERFAEGVSNASSQAAFFPFSGGPRICIGQNFAMIEAKLALAMILQHFSFELSPSYIHAPHNVITLQPQHGAPIILHRL